MSSAMYPVHGSAIRHINALKKQLAGMELHTQSVGDIWNPTLDVLAQAIKDHRDLSRKLEGYTKKGDS